MKLQMKSKKQGRKDMKSIKVVLDTNIWISFLITNNFNAIDQLINEGKIKLLFSEELIEEFVTVAKRPKFTKYFTNSDIIEIINLFNSYGKLVKVKTNNTDCRDLKDNFLLNLSIDGKADYLITGDSDLLILNKIKNTKIITFREFIKIIT